MFNKKYLIVAIVIIVIIFAFIILGLFLNSKNRSVEEPNTNNFVNESNINSTLIIAISDQLTLSEVYVKDNNKEACRSFSNDFAINNCLDAIELKEKAINENNFNICYSREYNVSLNLRRICSLQFENE